MEVHFLNTGRHQIHGASPVKWLSTFTSYNYLVRYRLETACKSKESRSAILHARYGHWPRHSVREHAGEDPWVAFVQLRRDDPPVPLPQALGAQVPTVLVLLGELALQGRVVLLTRYPWNWRRRSHRGHAPRGRAGVQQLVGALWSAANTHNVEQRFLNKYIFLTLKVII